ncbi:MAG: MraY family glycosyltransferase [Acidobacteriota bacterium]|nr:MraY family glycosyltransferase [Acidobacteriota bacterium]
MITRVIVADLLAFSAAFLASAIFTPAARELAFKVGLIDHPGPRKVHATPMPVLGGLAVYLAMVFAITVFVTDGEWSQLLGIFVASTLALVVGMLDDRGMLHHQIKLMLAMPFAALILIATEMHSTIFFSWYVVPVIGIPGAWLDYGLSFVWFVGIIAAFSILDHMDGLCAGVAAIAAAFFFSFAAVEGQLLVGTIAAAILGASLGFLRWNARPARIFLGDGGAMLLGLVTATLGIKLRFPALAPTISWMVPVLVLSVPIFDTTLVTVSRLRRGLTPFASPGKDHAAHRLVALGLTHRQAVSVLYGVSVLGGMLAWCVAWFGKAVAGPVAVVAVMGAVAAIVWLECAPYERQESVAADA